jgi:DNA-binding ferritin-like protein
MVRRTLDDLKHLQTRAVQVIDQAEVDGDRTTVNLFDDIHDGIEASAWMLQAFLDGR